MTEHLDWQITQNGKMTKIIQNAKWQINQNCKWLKMTENDKWLKTQHDKWLMTLDSNDKLQRIWNNKGKTTPDSKWHMIKYFKCQMTQNYSKRKMTQNDKRFNMRNYNWQIT